MMRIAISLVLAGCIGTPEDPVLRIEPAALSVDVELGVAKQVPFTLTADGVDVTAQATYALEGTAPLGGVDARGFMASASAGGRGEVVATFDGQTARVPVHVILHSRRFAGAPPDAPQWFREGFETEIDAALEPGDGSVLPTNLGRLDVHFAADDFEDVHEIAVTAGDIDLRVYAASTAGPRTVELTPEEWYAIAETNRGGSVELAVRSLRIISRGNVHTAKATLRIAELPIAREMLFTGRTGTEMPQMWSYDLGSAKTSAWLPQQPATSCLGCHVAISKDGRYIAAGGNNGTVGGGIILDAWTREFTAPPTAGIGNWIAAAYDPDGTLLTTTQGKLTHRDGSTGQPIREVVTDIPASQPTVSNDGRKLAYVGGPIDPVSTNPITRELRIQPWSSTAGSIGPSRVLIEPIDGEILKLPEFSPDDNWVMYSKVRSAGTSVFVRPADGRFIPIELVRNADFGRFASPLETVRAGAAAAEPMVWFVMKRYAPVGVRNQDRVGQLWIAAFFPERNVASRPIYLPGQRPDIAVLHAPLALPEPSL